jgi:hypothetical protein
LLLFGRLMINILYIKGSLFALLYNVMASWRNGYAEDCKSLYPSSILGDASKNKSCVNVKKK